MPNISLVTYAGQTVTPLDDALVYETAINKSGMIYGGVVTIKNANNLHISGGHGMVCGRKFTIFDSDIQVALSSSGTLLGRLYVQLDLSNIGTPIQLLVETGASLTPVQQDQNVNIQNGVYEFNLATFSVDTSTISNLVNVAPSAEPSTGAGSIITVTTAEASLKGKMCTLTDGVNTLNANFDNTGTAVFYGVQMVGTVIVNATDGAYYASSQITITYFGKYSTTLAFWGATVNLTTSTADFYGQTINVTQDGIAVGSTAFDGAGSATYIAPAAGTYVFTVTYGGNDYSTTVVVTAETTYSAVINNGFILADWLSAGGVTGTYADLAAVLADEDAVRQLMTIHAAVDYLASFEATDASVVTILNDNYAAKWISLTDYAEDTLEAAYGTLMGTIGKYGYGEWGITDATTTPPTWGALGNVPVMTSNSAPYGEASASSISESATPAYAAFNGNLAAGNGWRPTSGATNNYIQYEFTNPVCAKKIAAIFYITNSCPARTFTIKASNDGFASDTHDVGTLTLTARSTTGNTETISANLTTDAYYKYYRVFCADTLYVSGSWSCTMEMLQLFGRTLKVSVPKMSGNTTPYGEASANAAASGDFGAYGAFDSNASHGWYIAQTPAYKSGDWIQYKFVNKILLKSVRMQLIYYANADSLTFSVQGSDDGVTFENIETGLVANQSSGSPWQTFDTPADKPYSIIRIAITSGFSTQNTDGINIQFFGKDYSEREWDTTHPRRYLYDHGVEVETLTGYRENSGVATKHPSELEFGIGGQTYSIAEFYTGAIDFTDYSLFRAVAGDKITELLIQRIVTVTPYTANMFDGTQNSVATKTTSASDASLPYNAVLDIASVNGSYYAMVLVSVATGTNYRLGTIKELWLE